MNYIIGVERISHICVADPYYMHEGFLGVCAKHREYARDYIVSFMLANKDKGAILVPIIPCKSSALLSFLRFQSFICTVEAN